VSWFVVGENDGVTAMGYVEEQSHHSGAGRAMAMTAESTSSFDADGFDADVVVIGGGLAGLTAAAFAARGGASVVLLERSDEVGGRAATHDNDGFLFNVGPHALYDGGPAAKALAELGVRYSGRRPSASGGLAFHDGKLSALPGGFVSLLTTDLLSLSGKLELGQVLGSLAKIDAHALSGQTLRQWLDATFRDDVVRSLVEALMRVTSYANDPARSCAAASVAQLQDGLGKGVLYLDGGWATLAGGLRKAAEEAGVLVRNGQRVRSVTASDDHVEVVIGPSRFAAQVPTDVEEDEAWLLRVAARQASEGSVLRARVVVLAVPPAVAAAITHGPGGETLRGWAADATPVKAACLDLGLRRLPDPRRLFVVGIDRPLYFSVHSASARLAPEGAAVIHVAKYLGSQDGKADAKAVQAELEAFCDVVQPGWRREVVERRYLPSMLVTGALVEAGKSRPGPEVAGAPSLLVAGDWVGDVSMIADAAVASGSRAGTISAAKAVAAKAAMRARGESRAKALA